MKNFLFILILFSISNCIAKDSTEINYYKLGAIGGVTIGGFIYGHALQTDIWWKGEKSSFRFEWDYDWKYALGADKFGHFYFPYLMTNVYSDAFQWSGIEKKKSLYYAASLAFLYQTYIEVRDGFSKEWGFSWGDFAANTIGATYPILQDEIPFLKNINMKLSFYPSERFKNNSHSVIMDDYESTYHWLTFNIYNFLPDNIKSWYPQWINLAIGHGVRELDSPNGGRHEVFIALDWNLEALPGESSFIKLLKKYLNFYKLPAPAVQITPELVWFGLKF